jgi:hypothetical protein
VLHASRGSHSGRLKKKQEAFAQRRGTTHWPNAKNIGDNIAKRDGGKDIVDRLRPVEDPVLSERAFRLTGIPYIEAEV